MDNLQYHTENLRLVAHPVARDQAVAAIKLHAGSTIISVPSLTTVLLESEKGHRCDACHRTPPDGPLRRCAGCASYWYCDAECQSMQWKSHHKRLCKMLNKFTLSSEFQALQPHEKSDALLLSNLAAQISPSTISGKDVQTLPILVFLSLLPGPITNIKVPPTCPLSPSVPSELLNTLYSRFGNNNFSMHSHLTTYGHGIFPMASRLFNHSCCPNAVARYLISPHKPVIMEIVALRDILPDEEVCLPYLDPALLQTRHQILQYTYGFCCDCRSCLSLRRIGTLPRIPEDPSDLDTLSQHLREFIGIQPLSLLLPNKSLDSLPNSLFSVLHEVFLADLSETFSKSSHEGQYDLALSVGSTILALYALIYPPKYPQIGMHLLELAKTQWNQLVISGDLNGGEEAMKKQTYCYLNMAKDILVNLGPEGDEYGPLQEIETLESLLSQ